MSLEFDDTRELTFSIVLKADRNRACSCHFRIEENGLAGEHGRAV